MSTTLEDEKKIFDSDGGDVHDSIVAVLPSEQAVSVVLGGNRGICH